jgi:hypothetical protein
VKFIKWKLGHLRDNSAMLVYISSKLFTVNELHDGHTLDVISVEGHKINHRILPAMRALGILFHSRRFDGIIPLASSPSGKGRSLQKNHRRFDSARSLNRETPYSTGFFV